MTEPDVLFYELSKRQYAREQQRARKHRRLVQRWTTQEQDKFDATLKKGGHFVIAPVRSGSVEVFPDTPLFEPHRFGGKRIVLRPL